jgi:hypothetical protein
MNANEREFKLKKPAPAVPGLSVCIRVDPWFKDVFSVRQEFASIRVHSRLNIL